MNPTGTGLLVLKGKLVGSKGWGKDLLGCSVSAYIVGKESGTAHEFMKGEKGAPAAKLAYDVEHGFRDEKGEFLRKRLTVTSAPLDKDRRKSLMKGG